MQIGELAQRAGVTAPTIRYYEEVGVMPLPRRAHNGYRVYDEGDVERLRFITRARALDFSLEEIGEILELRERGKAPCAYVLAQLDAKLAEIEQRIENLVRLRSELQSVKQSAEALPLGAIAARSQICHILQNRQIIDLEEPERPWKV